MQVVHFLLISCLPGHLVAGSENTTMCGPLCDGVPAGSQVSGGCCTEDFCLCGEDGGVLLGCTLPGYLFCNSLQTCVDQNRCSLDNCCTYPTTTTSETTTITPTTTLVQTASPTSSVSGCSDNIAFSSDNFPEAKLACYDADLVEV